MLELEVMRSAHYMYFLFSSGIFNVRNPRVKLTRNIQRSGMNG